MKLFEIAGQPVDWNTKSEKQQIAGVRFRVDRILNINNPSEAVQLEVVNQHGYNINCIRNPTQKVVLAALKNLDFIELQENYEAFVKKYFANNTILMKKWLRYGEAMREV
jgi:hypothetical protein